MRLRSMAKASVPWLLFFLFLLVPLYVVSISFAIRSGVLDLHNTTIGADEYKALWAFIASGLATAATVVGLLFARSHNQRTSDQLALDTAVKSLELLANEGGYAPRARVAGALAALVHLGHPTIAMRTLDAAWEDNAVDTSTATWLIGEVFRSGSNYSKNEAGALLQLNASKLTRDEEGVLNWPDYPYNEWIRDAPPDARLSVLHAIAEVLMSKPRNWWPSYTWALALLDEVRRTDKEPGIRNNAATILEPLLAPYEHAGDMAISWGTRYKTIADIQRGMKKHPPDGLVSSGAMELAERLRAWVQEDPEASDNEAASDHSQT
jgi:hypothetical protein